MAGIGIKDEDSSIRGNASSRVSMNSRPVRPRGASTRETPYETVMKCHSD